jgi:hypothetical protein
VLVKRRQYLDSAGTVMNLVTNAPQKVGIVTCAVPPVKNESADEPSQQTLRHRSHRSRNVKNRPTLRPTVPRDASEQDDAHLARIQECCAGIPSGSFRQFPSGKYTLGYEE